MARLTTRQLAAFAKGAIRPGLGPDYFIHKGHRLARMHGPFVQVIALSVSRGGALRLHPTLFVAGADPSLPVIPQTLSLEVLDPRKWSFADPVLDATLARLIVERIERETPLSFTAPLTPAGIEHGLRFFAAQGEHWAAHLYCAAYLLTAGQPEKARRDLSEAQRRFDRLGQRVLGPPPEWRTAMALRLRTLAQRLALPDGLALCRADAQMQAAALGLPDIRWM